jgi:hypothetical protein
MYGRMDSSSRDFLVYRYLYRRGRLPVVEVSVSHASAPYDHTVRTVYCTVLYDCTCCVCLLGAACRAFDPADPTIDVKRGDEATTSDSRSRLACNSHQASSLPRPMHTKQPDCRPIDSITQDTAATLVAMAHELRSCKKERSTSKPRTLPS